MTGGIKYKDISYNDIIVGQNHHYSRNDFQTKRNNNVLVLGGPGAGKTTRFSEPNLAQAYSSYVVTEAKHVLSEKYAEYFQQLGYQVMVLDFVNQERSCHYNPLRYISSEQDIMKLAYVLAYQDVDRNCHRIDPFWDEQCQIAIAAGIAYVMETELEENWTMRKVCRLFDLMGLEESEDPRQDSENVYGCSVVEEIFSDKDIGGKKRVSRRSEKINHAGRKTTEFDRVFLELHQKNPDSFAWRLYLKYNAAPDRTYASITSTVHSKIGSIDYNEMLTVLDDDDIDLRNIGVQPTVCFVEVSDTDRSMDTLVNIFFSQAIMESVRVADRQKSRRLPIDVTFMMDDFGTNVIIRDFPRIISSSRSRGISFMLLLQSESQLRAAYGDDANTIIAGCDTIVYMGGLDMDTASHVARRADIPMQAVLNMPVGHMYVFRRGCKPAEDEWFPAEEFCQKKKELVYGYEMEGWEV